MSAEYLAWLLIAHFVGDYLLQSDWMATEKTRRWWPAIVHGLAYGAPFLLLAPSAWAWLTIAGTHIVLDRYRLARHIVYARNHLAPAGRRPSWGDSRSTGSPSVMPAWQSTWLVVMVDNTMHVAINLLAVIYL